MHVHNIVLLSQRGRLTCSPEKELQIESTVYHLGVLKRGFETRLFDENLMENIDEMHFVVNMDNGRTLGFWADISVKCAEVVSDGDLMTIVVRISGGRRSMIEAPMLIFTNPNNSYLIQGLYDNTPGVSYRIGSKGWMDQGLFADFFQEPCAFQPNLHGCTKTIWVDNCMGYNLTPRLQAVLQAKYSILRYLQPCSTHLCQPVDTFIVSKIKMLGQNNGRPKKLNLLQEMHGKTLPGKMDNGLGNLQIPVSSSFYAADSVEDVNREVDCDNISYAQKAMIRSGMALGLDGTWSVHQLCSRIC